MLISNKYVKNIYFHIIKCPTGVACDSEGSFELVLIISELQHINLPLAERLNC